MTLPNGIKTHEITLHPYHWESFDSKTFLTEDVLYDQDLQLMCNTPQSCIRCWCLDKNSESILLHFDDYEPICYVELPTCTITGVPIKWTKKIVKDLTECLMNKCGFEFEWKAVSRSKLYYSKTCNCIEIKVSSDEELKKIKYSFNKTIIPLIDKESYSSIKDDPSLLGKISAKKIFLRAWECTGVSVYLRMCIAKKLSLCQWFKVKAYYLPNTYPLRHGTENIDEYVASWKDIIPIPSEESMSWKTEPKLVAIDIEVYTPNHKKMPVAVKRAHVCYMISIISQKGSDSSTRKRYLLLYGDCSEIDDVDIIKTKTEEELYDEFSNIVNKLNPDVMIYYNGCGFDVPYMDARKRWDGSEWKTMGRLKGHVINPEVISWHSSAYGDVDQTFFKIPGCVEIDLLPYIKRDFKLPKYSLDVVARHFLGVGKHDMPIEETFKIYERSVQMS